MQLNELRELGLDDNEIKVYLQCLRDGGSNVKDISKKSELIRTTVYGVLNSLMKKGLVSTLKKDKILFFKAASPKELIAILDHKKEKITSILPELEKIQKTALVHQRVEFFEGREGVKTVIDDILTIPDSIVKIIGAGKKWVEFSSSFAAVYYRKKKEVNVKTKTILSDIKEERSFLKNKIVKNSEFRFAKGIDVTRVGTFIYQDKVSFVSYDGENPRGFIIQDKEFNNAQNILFDNLWKNATK